MGWLHSPRRGRSSLSAQYVLVKQRRLFHYRRLAWLYKRRTCHILALEKLCSVFILCIVFILAFSVTSQGLKALIYRASTELHYLPLWHGLLYGGCFVYSLLLGESSKFSLFHTC